MGDSLGVWLSCLHSGCAVLVPVTSLRLPVSVVQLPEYCYYCRKLQPENAFMFNFGATEDSEATAMRQYLQHYRDLPRPRYYIDERAQH